MGFINRFAQKGCFCEFGEKQGEFTNIGVIFANLGAFCEVSLFFIPREASTLIFKIWSCALRTDLKNMQKSAENGRLIFIHLQCWEVLPFCCFQRQRCIKMLCPKDPDFYTPLGLKKAKEQHLPALKVYKKPVSQKMH